MKGAVEAIVVRVPRPSLKFCSKNLATALKGAFGGVNSFPICEVRGRGSEGGQTGGD